MSKGQAIAHPHCAICTTPNCCGDDGKCLEEYIKLRLTAQPECRTCRDNDRGECVSFKRCTNGDKYQPAPKVVLWRTE